MEVWKEVVPGYKVSNYGNVKGPRGILTKQPCESKGGNIYYRVKINGKYFSLHRIVAKAFIQNPLNKQFIDHIDRDPSNNKVENLRWSTGSENMINTNDRTNNRNIYLLKSGKYSVQLRRNYEMVFTATADTLEEAIQIRNQKIQELDNHTPPEEH